MHFCEINHTIYAAYLAKINIGAKVVSYICLAVIYYDELFNILWSLWLCKCENFEAFIYLGIWFLFSHLGGSRQTTRQTVRWRDCSVFAFFIIQIDAIILCFYYMCLESINLTFIIACCKISTCWMSWHSTATIIGWNAILWNFVKMTDYISFTPYVSAFTGLVPYFSAVKYQVEKH